jgi:undecaprenyl-diphosphatase
MGGMQLLQALILGIVQGLTEFIPVSSSGHLILVEKWLGFAHSGLTFDVALHIGTLGALLLFFRKDFLELGMALFKPSEKTKLARLLILATIPAVVVGSLLQSKAEAAFRSEQLVAINLIVVAFVMLAADRWGSRKHDLGKVTAGRALSVGFAQALAVVPGVSRSGITISAGLLQGFDRTAATRFSFLLSAPIIAGAILKVLAGGHVVQDVAANAGVFIVGVLASLISGYLAIKFLLSYLKDHGLGAFALYRIVLGVLILMVGQL